MLPTPRDGQLHGPGALLGLHANHVPIAVGRVARDAVDVGNLEVLVWVWEYSLVTPGVNPITPDEVPGLLQFAALSGTIELMVWLRARGWGWGPHAIDHVARSGCEAALEWMVEQGCPVEEEVRRA